MKRAKSLITIGAFSLVVLFLPAIASAQWGGYGGNNGGYGGYGGYGGNYDTRSIIRDLKNRSRDFERQLDRDLDNSRYNGTRREDQLNALAKDFRRAVNRLNGNNYNGNGRYDNRQDYRLQEVFSIASRIDRSIGRRGLNYNSQYIWQQIRYDLERLGSYNGGGYNNRNRNGGWNRGNRNGLPSWWPF